VLQVMVSIQAQILGVDDPFFSEPGFERRTGERAQPEAEKYDQSLWPSTLEYAVLEMLRNTPFSKFQQVISEHFKHKADDVLQTIDGWIKRSDGSTASRLQRLRESIKGELHGPR
jgi:hypothetical protein